MIPAELRKKYALKEGTEIWLFPEDDDRISYSDGFAAALAKFRNAELVTGDREFRQLGNEVQIHWCDPIRWNALHWFPASVSW